jgi:hypothetical protein
LITGTVDQRDWLRNGEKGHVSLLRSGFGIAHLARLLKEWTVQIGTLSLSMSVSSIGLLVVALLAFWGLMQLVQ